ncbi:MAG: rhodanese-like domain-containing protein, partial [Burkholderiales bacterium]|nr:rhodanese-like domain-containing protein [Burkholderiales bacterium]
MLRQLTAAELARWLADPAASRPVLLDVREPWEYEICRIEGARGSCRCASFRPARPRWIGRPTPCSIRHHGGRSLQAALFLAREGFSR